MSMSLSLLKTEPLSGGRVLPGENHGKTRNVNTIPSGLCEPKLRSSVTSEHELAVTCNSELSDNYSNAFS